MWIIKQKTNCAADRECNDSESCIIQHILLTISFYNGLVWHLKLFHEVNPFLFFQNYSRHCEIDSSEDPVKVWTTWDSKCSVLTTKHKVDKCRWNSPDCDHSHQSFLTFNEFLCCKIQFKYDWKDKKTLLRISTTVNESSFFTSFLSQVICDEFRNLQK